MNVQKAIETKRAVRLFTTDPVPAEVIDQILDAGRRSQSSKNTQPWQFVVVQNPETLIALSKTGDYAGHLAGAAFADKRCQERDPRKNPAAMNALIQFLLDKKGKNMVVMMPYAQRLKDVADWFRQLWAESLGKHIDRAGKVVNVGPTPIKSLGVTDQHSQVQLYAEGPFDKIFNFLFVDEYQTNAPLVNPYPDVDELAYLGGQSFDALIKAEAEATQLALTEAGRPNVAHHFPAVNAFTLGQFYYLLEQQTAIAGELYNINAFDQPGVEAGKVATYALMGRTGYDQRRHEIEESRGKRSADFVI